MACAVAGPIVALDQPSPGDLGMNAKGDFESHRDRLMGIAYRMLGSVAEAEDVVQDAWMRWRDAKADAVRDPGAYLSTIVSRLCLDRLKSARVQRTSYCGPWLPEPTATVADEPADVETISMAFLVILETLSPVERAVFLLHHVYGYGFAEVGEIVGKDEATCRQMFRRARQRVEAGRPRFRPSAETHTRLLLGFWHAARSGDPEQLQALLTEDAAVWADGGGKAFAARRPVIGAGHVARYMAGLGKKALVHMEIQIVELNGAPSGIVRFGDAIDHVLTIDVEGDRIRTIRVVRNPDKLAHLTTARLH
jgi:RNA polymerase sigma-70 factor (ECF subfamily)